MKRTRKSLVTVFFIAFLIGVLAGCVPGTTKHATSVVDYLYPDSNPVIEPGIPVLKLPLRVGIAFVPSGEPSDRRYGRDFAPYRGGDLALTETRKQDLMREVADHFKKYPYVKEIEIIPSAYLKPRGSFTNLGQIRTMYGVDVIALLSYDQVQFTDQGSLSLSYWTIVGAYVIPGEKNDTHTMMDAVVYDITSRKMLFRAPGTSHIKGSATPVNLSEELRADSDKGFTDASREMIVNLDEQLTNFKEKVKERPEEYKVVPTTGYRGGGSFDSSTLMLLIGLGGYFLWTRRSA
jgi:rhombotail lipoprotein